MKKTISTIICGLAISIPTVFAEETTAPVPTLYQAAVTTSEVETPKVYKEVNMQTLAIPSNVSATTERSEIIGAKSLERIKARGAQLIKERVNSLNQNAQAVEKSKGLTTEQKMAFSAYFDGKIAELNTLNAKIKEGTVASSTKVLVESIFTDYRIYGIALPQVRLQKRIYEVQNHIANLSEKFNQIQTNIDIEKAKGKDVTVWQKSLDDARLNVATNTAKLSNLMTQVSALKVSDYGTTSKKIIESTNNEIKMIAREISYINKKVHRPAYMKTTKATTTIEGVR